MSKELPLEIHNSWLWQMTWGGRPTVPVTSYEYEQDILYPVFFNGDKQQAGLARVVGDSASGMRVITDFEIAFDRERVKLISSWDDEGDGRATLATITLLAPPDPDVSRSSAATT